MKLIKYPTWCLEEWLPSRGDDLRGLGQRQGELFVGGLRVAEDNRRQDQEDEGTQHRHCSLIKLGNRVTWYKSINYRLISVSVLLPRSYRERNYRGNLRMAEFGKRVPFQFVRVSVRPTLLLTSFVSPKRLRMCDDRIALNFVWRFLMKHLRWSRMNRWEELKATLFGNDSKVIF